MTVGMSVLSAVGYSGVGYSPSLIMNSLVYNSHIYTMTLHHLLSLAGPPHDQAVWRLTKHAL